MIENPMIRPLSESEEIAMMSDEDIIESSIECKWCGNMVIKYYSKKGMHKNCFEEAKADYIENEKDN